MPQVHFQIREDETWKTVTTDELFKNKTVVLFSLPGAFTPTCSASHVPRYNELADAFKTLGVDDIICASVNDTFVMNAWKEDQKADRVTFLPDGNGAFTEGMGMLVDKQSLGFGKRSWRYSMLVKDGIIQKQFIEPEVEGDPFNVSDADTMLTYLAGDKEKPSDIVLFTKANCGHCARAKSALAEAKLSYAEVPASPRVLKAVSSEATTPRVFINGKLIGGADELATWLQSR